MCYNNNNNNNNVVLRGGGERLFSPQLLTPLLSSASLVSVPARIQWFASFWGRRKKKLRPPPPPPQH